MLVRRVVRMQVAANCVRGDGGLKDSDTGDGYK